MITHYKNTDITLTTIAEPTEGCWINVIDPSPQELASLHALGIPRDYLTYPLDLDERARTEREDGDQLIILRIPYFQGTGADVPYSTIPLGIILTNDYILTICKLDNEILREFSSGRVKNLSTSKQQRFVLRILLITATKYLYYLREITRAMDVLEDQLQLSTRNKEVLELLKIQKSLTYFTTALRSNQLLMDHLQRTRLFVAYPEDEDLLEDVITENQQAIEMTSITSNILSSTMDAFASIISNNLNVVMKFLTSITIVISLPTIISSLYGMNVLLPLQNNPYAFLLILGISILVTGSAGYLFWKRDWF